MIKHYPIYSRAINEFVAGNKSIDDTCRELYNNYIFCKVVDIRSPHSVIERCITGVQYNRLKETFEFITTVSWGYTGTIPVEYAGITDLNTRTQRDIPIYQNMED